MSSAPRTVLVGRGWLGAAVRILAGWRGDP
jgi:hypothetical protein